MPDPQNDQVAPDTRRITRRTLLRGFVGGVAALGMGAAYARYVEPYWPAVERVPMDLPGVEALVARGGLRILQLSDLHVSPDVSTSYLRRQLERCATLGADVIVMTGDYVTGPHAPYLAQLAGLLPLLHAPLGVFAVLGNHDYGIYRRDYVPRGSTLGDRVAQVLSESGIVVLRNEMRPILVGGTRLQLVGVDDLWSGRCDVRGAFAEVDPSLPCIALTHNPDTIDELRGQPCHWVLAGHTHGGQVRIPFLGPPLLPVVNRQYDAGLFYVGEQRLYVNRGLGSPRRIRFNCRPEITLFTVTARR